MPDTTTELERAVADIPLTRSAREILDRAASTAKSRGANPTARDILQATLTTRGTLAEQSIRALGADPAAIASQLPPADASGAATIPLRQLLVNANREAQVLGHYQVDSIHLLLALIYSDSPETSGPLQKAGLTMYDLRRHLQAGTKADFQPGESDRASANRSQTAPPAGRARSQGSTSGITTRADTAALRQRPWPSLRGAIKISWVLFLLLGGIGLPGGAVYINRSALRSRSWDSAVSLAGPVGTLVCGVLIAIFIAAAGRGAWLSHLDFFGALAFLGFIEVVALVLNLLPVPGLDGFGVIRPWLPYSAQSLAIQYGQLGILAVFGALWLIPPVNQAFFGFVLDLSVLLGIDPRLIFTGQLHMRLR
jgi:Zn-dependent protease